MDVSAKNFLEQFEARWVEQWQGLARELAETHPIEWDVWSHHLGPTGHTAGIEFRCQTEGYAEHVYCLVDFADVESQPFIKTARLGWSAPQNFGNKEAFSGPVPLNPENWRSLDETMQGWSSLLEPVLVSTRPKRNCAVVSHVWEGVESEFEWQTVTGEEPDFRVWNAFLETVSGTLVLSPVAIGMPEGEAPPPREFERIRKKLLELEPDLDRKTVAAFMTQPPLQLDDNFSRPAHFADPPDRAFGYNGTLRQRLAPFPDAEEVLSFSRVAFSGDQALFMVNSSSHVELGERPRFIFGQRDRGSWNLREIPFDLGTLEPDEHFERPAPPLPSFDEVNVIGITSASYLTVDEAQGLPQFEIQLDSGRTQVFKTAARARNSRALAPCSPLCSLFHLLSLPNGYLGGLCPVDVKQRRLERLDAQLKEVLRQEAERLRAVLGEEVRCWGHEVGRANSIRGYCAGLACGDHALSVVVLDLHLFPNVMGRVLGPRGGVYQECLSGDSLDCLDDLPRLLEFYANLLQRPEDDNGEPTWYQLGREQQLEVGEASSEELEFLRAFLPAFTRDRGLEGWVLNSTTKTRQMSQEWTSVAHPHIQNSLPTLELGTLRAAYLPEKETDLSPLREMPQFSSTEPKEEVRWSDFYDQYPDATGLVTVSRPGFNSERTQALLVIRFGFGFPAGVTPGIQAAWSGAQSEEGPFAELLLLEKGQDWEVVGSLDASQDYPVAISEELERRRLAPLFESAGTAARLGVEGVKLERVWLDSAHRRHRRFDLCVRQAGTNTPLAVAHDFWPSDISRESPVVIDRPLLFQRDFHPEAIWAPLASFLKELGVVES